MAARKLTRVKQILAALLWLVAGAALAQPYPYPSKPIRIMVAFPPGGPTDIIARLVSPKMSEILGQPVVVENLAGAGGNIATGRVAKSEPDGYTILLHSSGFAVNPSLSSNAGYNPQKDEAQGIPDLAVSVAAATLASGARIEEKLFER